MQAFFHSFLLHEETPTDFYQIFKQFSTKSNQNYEQQLFEITWRQTNKQAANKQSNRGENI